MALHSNTRIVRVEWGHCDFAGIVFNPNYFVWFDHSTAMLFESAGFKKPALFERPDFRGWPLVDSRAKFLAPARFGDDIEIRSRFLDIRRSSFDIEHQVFNGGKLAVDAFETRVWTGPHPEDPKRIKSAPIPADILKAIGGDPAAQ